METQFIGPSDDALDKKKLYNLILEQWVADIIVDSILRIDEIERKYSEEFETRMVSNQTKIFFDLINKHKRPKFVTSEKKGTLKNNVNE